jgi:branched-chain amino acid transport system ATP-binding protein
MTGAALIEARNVSYRYGPVAAVNDVSVTVGAGEAVCVIGPNGAGKTTLARIVGGLYRPSRGTVLMSDTPLPRRAHEMVCLGIGSVLEGRHLFVEQSVVTNLELGCYRSGISRAAVAERLERVMSLFPALRKRANQRTSTMSGGEQQMVAIGRALMAEPKVLILDEPSMGLSPKIAGEVFDVLADLRQTGLAILLVEQNAPLAFELADRGYLMRQGSVVTQGTIAELSHEDAVRSAYLGA